MSAFGGKADIGVCTVLLRCKCLLLTQSGHPRLTRCALKRSYSAQGPVADEAGRQCHRCRHPSATIAVLKWHVLGVHTKKARNQCRRQQAGREDREREQPPVGDGVHLRVELVEQ